MIRLGTQLSVQAPRRSKESWTSPGNRSGGGLIAPPKPSQNKRGQGPYQLHPVLELPSGLLMLTPNCAFSFCLENESAASPGGGLGEQGGEGLSACTLGLEASGELCPQVPLPTQAIGPHSYSLTRRSREK